MGERECQHLRLWESLGNTWGLYPYLTVPAQTTDRHDSSTLSRTPTIRPPFRHTLLSLSPPLRHGPLTPTPTDTPRSVGTPRGPSLYPVTFGPSIVTPTSASVVFGATTKTFRSSPPCPGRDILDRGRSIWGVGRQYRLRVPRHS